MSPSQYLKVESNTLTREVEEEPSIVKEEDGKEEDEPEAEAELAEPPNSQTQTGDGGDGRYYRDAPNDDHLYVDNQITLLSDNFINICVRE